MTEKIINPTPKAPPTVIVVDLGSYQSKAGLSGDDIPRHFVQSLFGSLKTFDIKGHNIEYFVGAETKKRADPQSIYNPFQNGVIQNISDIQQLFQHIFDNEIQINPEKKSVVVTTPTNSSSSYKETIAEVLFEGFHISSLYMSSPTSLGLYLSSKFSGTVVDCGESFTQVSSIFDLNVIPHANNVSPVAGAVLNSTLQKTLKDIAYQFAGPNGRDSVRDFKEKHCVVVTSPDKRPTGPVDFTFPDGNMVQVNEDRYKATEVLFAPEQFGIKANGVSAMIYDSIMKTDIQLRPLLFSHIFLTGATTLLDGFAERVEKEVQNMVYKDNFNYQVHVVAHPKRANAAWIGGSIVGGLNVFPQMVAYSDEYKELGYQLIDRRFF